MSTWQQSRRGAIVGGAVLAVVFLLVFVPTAARVQAAGMFGSLRAPGQPAFSIAHRGASERAPENTLPAIRLALEGPAEFVEIDLMLSKDRVPVLMHDATVDRTTNGSGIVGELTFAELRELDAGGWLDPAFAGTRIPTFSEFLYDFAPSGKKALIELKLDWTESDIRLLGELVHESGAQDRVVFASKYFDTVDNLRRAAEEFPRLVIIRDLPADPVELLQAYDAIAIVVSLGSAEANPDAVTALHDAGLGLIVYTLNTKARWSSAISLGVDGIVSNRAGKLDSWLGKLPISR